MAKVTVIFDKPTTLSLPFEHPNGRAGNLTLLPGKNLVDGGEWACVCKKHSALLKKYPEVKEVKDAKVTEDETCCDITTVLPVVKSIELINNTFDLLQINAYLAQENNAKQPRKKVIDAIDKQIKVIQKANK